MNTNRHFFPLLAILVIFAISACGFNVTPRTSFEAVGSPAPPDYAQLKYWVAHPDKLDSADAVPVSTVQDGQSNAKADVFFLHPTMFWGKGGWNGDTDDDKLNKKIEKLAIRNQASIFNGAGRVFAPSYRQMVYGAFFEKDDPQSAHKAFVLAYSDLSRAFEYYLENENNGRPIIIAGHSQGSAHGIQLLKDYFDGKPLQKQLVAAYIPGWPVKTDTFKVIKPCASPEQTGCYASWCSYEWGATPKHPEWYSESESINPVTWKRDTVPSLQNQHKGTVMGGFDTNYEAVLSAQVKAGYLWVTRPKVKGNGVIASNNYHIADFNLFWMDVRENAELRVEMFLKQSDKATEE